MPRKETIATKIRFLVAGPASACKPLPKDREYDFDIEKDEEHGHEVKLDRKAPFPPHRIMPHS